MREMHEENPSTVRDQSAEQTQKRKVPPKWASGPFFNFEDYVKEADRILYVTVRGMVSVANYPPVAESIAKLNQWYRDQGRPNDVIGGDSRPDLDRIHADAEFAKKERDRGFPRLHAHAVVSIWAALETLIEDTVVAWLVNVPATLKSADFERIRVQVADYEGLAGEDKMRFLLQELKRSLRTEEKLGINQFESLLHAVSMHGPVSDDVRKNLFEMQQVRHVVVHRASIADKRFCEACPWFGVSPGMAIQLTHAHYVRYMEAITSYLFELMRRVEANLGIGADGSRGDEAQTQSRNNSAE